MEGRTMKALLRLVVAFCAGAWVLAFSLPGGVVAAAADGNGTDACGYASSTFNESTVMRWAQINGSGTTATFSAFANDEKGLLLGVNGATPMSSATQNGSNLQPGGASYHVSGASGGSPTATDPSGRPFYPALYITDLTTSPLNANGTGAGDFQNGGTPWNLSGGQPFVNDVFGTWSTATVSNGAYSVTPPLDKNDWNLGQGSDAPVGTTYQAMGDEGYGSEVRWNVSALNNNGQTIQPGHTYRIQVIEHDGDQNKSGGDAGEFCVTLKIPGVPAISLVKTQQVGSSGGFTHNDVTGNPGDKVNYQMTVKNTGQTPLTLNFTDPQCDAGTLSGPSPALTNNTLGVGNSVQYTCSHVLSQNDAPTFTNTANVVGTAPDGTQVQATDHVNANVQLKPGIQVVKAERIGNSGPFVHGPVYGAPGDTVNYQMTVTNTGNVDEPVSFSDPQCDSGTLSGPTPSLTNGKLPAGQSVVYTCSHLLMPSDTASGYTNTACATSGSLQSCDTVHADVPAISLVKAERIGSDPNSMFTHGPVTGNVGDTVNYRMTVTNTGSTTLTLAFTDDQCDNGTLSGPSPSLANNTLAAGQSVVYTCSHVLAAGDQPYTNTASVVGTPPSGPAVSAQDSVKAFANVPGIQVVKLQRDGSSGSFTSGQITASVGDTIEYEIQATNTGNVPLTLSVDDAHCDSTPQGPTSVSGTLSGDVLSPGGVAQYTCSHVVTANDVPQFTNTAVVTGTPPSGPPVHGTGIVVANVTQAAIQVLKLEKDAAAGGGFTTGPISVTEQSGNYVVHTIDYEIQVTNTGSAPLRLSLNDSRCDAGTIQGPAVITGTLSGDVLSPGGQAQYTCSHRYVQGDPTPFTNTATVTGTPPSGPAVHGTSSVTVTRTTVFVKHVCRTPSGRVIHYRGHRKPAACHRKPSRPPKHPRGFTG